MGRLSLRLGLPSLNPRTVLYPRKDYPAPLILSSSGVTILLVMNLLLILCRAAPSPSFPSPTPSPIRNGVMQLRSAEVLVPSQRNIYSEELLPLRNLRKHQIHRKLWALDRIGDECTMGDIEIFQGEAGPLPNGIPLFTVQIVNLCLAGCPISDIHVSCGWFASAKLINPKVFRRVKFNDCIVNDSMPLKGGDSITFEYANSFQYPLMVSSANTCCF